MPENRNRHFEHVTRVKLSFQSRTLLLLTGLVLLIQLVNLWAVLNTLSTDIQRQLRQNIEAANTRVDKLVRERSGLMHRSTEILASDFGFRTSVAGGDPTTIQAILRSKRIQLDADLAVMILADGTIINSHGHTLQNPEIFRSLARVADVEDMAADAAVVEGQAHELISVPVRLHYTVGWLVVGFLLDDVMAERFSQQVGMDVSFLAADDSSSVFGSTLSIAASDAFGDAMSAQRRVAGKADSDSVAEITLSGEKLVFRLVPVSSALAGVDVVLSQSLDSALAGYRSVRNQLLGYMVLSLLAALGLAFWFSRSVTRPVELLSSMASHVREGDYEQMPDARQMVDRGDEFGELLNTFVQMQEGIAKRESTITYFAYHDELTGLPNRRRVQDQLLGVMEISRIKRRKNAVILLGLKRYKQILDTLGHKVGESLIKALGKRLSQLCSDVELVARVAHDEFLVLICDCDENRAELLALEWIDALEEPVALAEASMVPEFTAGVVVVPRNASTVDSAMRRASIALSDSRERQLPVCHYEQGRDESYMRKLAILADLKQAVEQDELVVHYQPKVLMQSAEVESVEALVRWIHPRHGFLPPDEFIGLAESSGNIGLLTDWMLKTVIAQLGRWRDQGILLKAAVNLSALDLQDEQLLERICSLLAQHDVDPKYLILEVTESAMMKDTERALQTLSAMREKGLAISIDDFGTGYSSMSQLKDLPVDELKIDRAFVVGIEPGSTKAMIMKAIIGLGHGMGLRVVCEGVETQEEWELLTQLGSDVAQGYLISRPLALDDFDQWWADRNACDNSAAA